MATSRRELLKLSGLATASLVLSQKKLRGLGAICTLSRSAYYGGG